MRLDPSRFLGAFAGTATIAAGAFLLGASPPRTLSLERLDIREPDGTLRLVLSSAARAPGIIVAGHEQPHPSRRSAGMLFYNEDGTENGGLIFDGRREASGTRTSSGSLTFDRNEQDQVVQLMGDEDGPRRTAGLVVNDQPDAPMDWAAIERARHLPPPQRDAAFAAAHAGGTRRAFLGRATDGTSELTLRDAHGTPRLRLAVSPGGAATIEFLDAGGKIVRTLGPG